MPHMVSCSAQLRSWSQFAEKILVCHTDQKLTGAVGYVSVLVIAKGTCPTTALHGPPSSHV